MSQPPQVLSNGSRAAVYAAATVSVFVWGATPIATKIGVNHIDPLLVGVVRTVIGGAIALPIVLVMRIPLPKTARQLKLLALSAFCGFVAFTILFSIGQSRTSGTHTGLIFASIPIFTFASIPIFTGIFAFLIERRGPSVFWWVGGAIALAGEAYIILFRGGDDGGGATLAGDALVLVVTMIVCLGYVIGLGSPRSAIPPGARRSGAWCWRPWCRRRWFPSSPPAPSGKTPRRRAGGRFFTWHSVRASTLTSADIGRWAKEASPRPAWSTSIRPW